MEEKEEVGFDEPDMKDVFCVSSGAKQKFAYTNFCDRASVQNI